MVQIGATSIDIRSPFPEFLSPGAAATSYSCLALLLLYVLWSVISSFTSSLGDVPGPWLARYTRLWLFAAICSRRFDKINIRLHRKYGPIVRVAPNQYSIDDPEAVSTIYRSRDQLAKAPRYAAWGQPGSEPYTFTATDVKQIETAAKKQRNVASLYSMSALYSIEEKIDQATATFMERMAAFSSEKVPVDLSEWFQFYAFDSIGNLTYGKPFDFLRKGEDISEILSTIHNYSVYGGFMGIFSEWHPLVFRLLNALTPGGGVGKAGIASFTAKAIAERNARTDSEKSVFAQRSENGNSLHSDYLSTWLARHNQQPEKFPVSDINYHAIPHLSAGGETTGISMTAVVYFLMKNSRVLGKLREELSPLWTGSPNQRISMKQVQDLPYLQAVIKEALRIFPATGFILPRVVPEGGLVIAGRHFPAGAIVGINSWVASANKTVFAPDPDSFRPERWLENEATSFRMEQYFFTFGRGPRACGGKNIAMMELSKIIPEFILRFDFTTVDPGREWEFYNDWIVRQTRFRVNLTARA